VPVKRRVSRAILIAATLFALGSGAQAGTPLIRTSSDNVVPRCVTPQRLMAFLKTRNSSLDPSFANIATYYKQHGEKWRVRWDYAFFQMALETNFLTYRRGDGRWGDVNPRQNNFAGLGTTGGGVPGDSYPDVSTGVLAQIQHLVVYSGERIPYPVGNRTRLKQDHILEASAPKAGRMTFADLTRRWAADRNYGRSIEWVATLYRENYCRGQDRAEADPRPAATTPPPPVKRMAASELPPAANLGGPEASSGNTGAPVRTVWQRTNSASAPNPDADKPSRTAAAASPILPTRKPDIPAPAAEVAPREQVMAALDPDQQSADLSVEPAPSATQPTPREDLKAFAFASGMTTARTARQTTPPAGGCHILSASYGGKKALLLQSGTAPQLRFTVLTVLAGFEKSMLDNYLRKYAKGATKVGEFANRDAALAKARELCPGSATAASEGVGAG
jgi:hypothetical protein